MNIVKREFKSASGPGTYIAVIDTDTGANSCNCRGWIFQRPGKPRGCKHTHALLAEFGFASGAVLAPKFVKFAQPAKSGAQLPKAAPNVVSPPKVVTPEALAKAQVEVEKALALVKGRRSIEIEDDEPVPVAAPKVAAPPPAVASSTKALSAADVLAVLNAEAAPVIKPQLASAMPEGAALSDYCTPEWVLEEKIDGHRLLLVRSKDKVTGWTRPGAERPAAIRPLPPPLVADALSLPCGIYDGELYVPGGTSSDVVRLDKADELRLALFDVVEALGVTTVDKPLSQRRAVLDLCVAHCPKGGRVFAVEQQPVSLVAVKSIWEAKGEGAILKRLDSTYRSGYRSPSWIKVKQIAAAELTVVGFEAGKNGPHSVLKLRHNDGRETTVKVLTQEMLRAIEKNPSAYIGKRLVISYMGLTTSGKWRHPVLDHFAEEAA